MMQHLNAAQTLLCVNTTFLNLIQVFIGHLGACRQNNFASFLVCQGLRQNAATQAASPAQLFIKLITTDICQVITLVVKEGIFNQLYSVFQNNRLAGTQLFVKLQHSLIPVMGSILL